MRLSFENLYAVTSPRFFVVSVLIKGSNHFEEFRLLLDFANKHIRVWNFATIICCQGLKFRYHYLLSGSEISLQLFVVRVWNFATIICCQGWNFATIICWQGLKFCYNYLFDLTTQTNKNHEEVLFETATNFLPTKLSEFIVYNFLTEGVRIDSRERYCYSDKHGISIYILKEMMYLIWLTTKFYKQNGYKISYIIKLSDTEFIILFLQVIMCIVSVKKFCSW
jgi:hypothetical protein